MSEHNERHHRRRSAIGGMTLGALISILFLAAMAAAASIIYRLETSVQDAQAQSAYNAARIDVWNAEIAARKADIDDLEHFVPSHGHPAVNPPSNDPTVPPQPHN